MVSKNVVNLYSFKCFVFKENAGSEAQSNPTTTGGSNLLEAEPTFTGGPGGPEVPSSKNHWGFEDRKSCAIAVPWVVATQTFCIFIPTFGK